MAKTEQMAQAAELAAPVSGENRIELLDALRGFALLGILLANFTFWSGIQLAQPGELTRILDGVPEAAFVAVFNFVLDGKFYTIFSFLFGLGFSLQLERLLARRADALRIFYRRTAVLLAFGLIHLCLVWDGDILTWYALIGFLLPLFRSLRDIQIIAIAATCIFVIPITLAPYGGRLAEPVYLLGDRIYYGMGGPVEDPANPVSELALLGQGGWPEVRAWIFSGSVYAFAGKLENWRFFKILGTMLIGMVAGRHIAAGTLLENRKVLWAVLLAGLAIGLPAGWVYAGHPPYAQNSLPSMIGTLPLGLAYAAGFALAWDRIKPVGRLLVPVGRMALTNYLAHSILGVVLFYGIGFGLMGRATLIEAYAIALAIFAAQVGFSHWWLRRHPQGPLEALWRRFTYGTANSVAR